MVERNSAEAFVAKVDSQNRITISKHVRDLLGIRPGIKVRARVSVIEEIGIRIKD